MSLLLAYLRAFATNYYDIISSIKFSEGGCLGSSAYNSKEIVFRDSEGFNSENRLLGRLYGNGKNKGTRVCQRQKALLKRINEDIKGIEAKIEEDIQAAFSRKIRSRRWNKRHHYV